MSLHRPTYNPATRRYRTPAGAVAPAAIRQAVNAVAQGAADRIGRLGEQLDRSEINLSQFMLDLRSAVKAAHVAGMAAASGGLDRLDPRSLGGLGSKLRSLYRGLDDLEAQYRAGTISAPMLAARALGYARAAAGTYENAVRDQARDAGDQEERRVLGVAEHCQQCVDQAALGWQPMGSLIPIGLCTCGGNCRCSWETR